MKTSRDRHRFSGPLPQDYSALEAHIAANSWLLDIDNDSPVIAARMAQTRADNINRPRPTKLERRKQRKLRHQP